MNSHTQCGLISAISAIIASSFLLLAIHYNLIPWNVAAIAFAILWVKESFLHDSWKHSAQSNGIKPPWKTKVKP